MQDYRLKKCPKCKLSKPISEFSVDKHTKSGLTCYCKSCGHLYYITDYKKKGRNRHLIKKYKLTEEEYNKLYILQNGSCAICGTKTPGRNRQYFNFDHNHITGKIRGLLCHNCNFALGLFNDNIKSLNNAIVYLNKGN